MNSINVYAGMSSGERVFENIHVEKIGDETYLVLASPGVVEGFAKGDKIRFSQEDASVEVVKRWGNLCVQLFITPEIKPFTSSLVCKVRALEGSLDGETEKNMVFTIPASSGFQKVEELFENFMEEFPDASWCYGNVYGSDGQTPLNWWVSSSSC